MLAYSCWLCLVISLTEAVRSPGYASICDLGPCTCPRGKVHCDCSQSSLKEIILEHSMLRDYLISSIRVANCNRVHIASLAVSRLSVLQQVSLTNIANLTLEEQAFSWTTRDPRHTGLALDISHCTVPEIPSFTFRGSLGYIILNEVNISCTQPFAFSAIDHADKLQFTNVYLTNISPQTFKKFSVNFLLFIDCYIDLFPIRTMVNVQVHKEARFQNTNVGRIKTAALRLHGVQNFKIVKSTIDFIERNALQVYTTGDVSISDNTFSYLERGAFLDITVDDTYLRDAGKQDFVFENNTMTHAERAALAFNTTGFNMRLDWIRMFQSCSCNSVDFWLNDLVIFYSFTNAMIAPQVNTIIYCLDPKSSTVRDYQKRNCEASWLTTGVTIILVVSVVFVLTALGIIVYRTINKKGKRYINVPPLPLSSLKPAESNKAHILVVPDGKTYRETELHVIVEHVEPILSTEYVKERPDLSE